MSNFRHIFSKTIFLQSQSTLRQNIAIQRCKISTFEKPFVATFQLKTLSQYEKKSFINLLPELVNDLTYNGEHQGMPSVTDHLSKVIHKNAKVSNFFIG